MELSWLKSGKAHPSYSYLPVSNGDTVKAPESERHISTQDSEDINECGSTEEKLAKWRVWTTIVLILSSCMLLFVAFTHRAIIIDRMTDAEPVLSQPNIVSAFKSIVHPDPPTSLWGNVAKPYPTGAFWTNLVTGTGEGAVGLYPYGIKTLDVGIQVSYGASRRIVSRTAITDNFVADWQISAVQANTGTRAVERHDKFSVTMGYKTASNGKYRAHLVKCSPFVTVVYDNAAPLLTSNLMRILSVEAQNVKDSSGVQYVVTLGNYQKWLVYCSEPLALSWSGNSLSSLTPIKGYIRVAILPLQNFQLAFSMLMQYVRKYPTGAIVQMQYPSDRVTVMHIEYTTVGDGSLLMLALPHHRAAMVEPNEFTDENIRVQSAYDPIWCIKGKLRAIIGTVWRLQYNLAQVGWNYIIADKLTTEKLDEIARELIGEIHQYPPAASDPYGFGKQLARLATLALLADNLGIADARKAAVTIMQDALTPWLLGTNLNVLNYDSTYGGIVSSDSVSSFSKDFGSGWYNDHHFHYGYIVYAAAAIAKIDSTYFADTAKKNAMDALVKDICGFDEADNMYPVARHKDFFDGHSWASGLWQQGNGKGQESSSEAVNAYYGVFLYSLATQNTDLQQFSNAMLTLEIAATQVYWHMSSADIYDAVFAASRMVGNVGALDVTASTWFGDKAEFVHGINIMPLTPVTALLFDPTYVQLEYPLLAARLRESHSDVVVSNKKFQPECAANKLCSVLAMVGACCPTPEGVMLGCCDSQQPSSNSNASIIDEWKALLYCDLAVVDRDSAWDRLRMINTFGSGNSKSNALYWTASRTAPVPGFNASAPPAASQWIVPSACSANSACDALGMVGECCQSPTGTNLACCPRLAQGLRLNSEN